MLRSSMVIQSRPLPEHDLPIQVSDVHMETENIDQATQHYVLTQQSSWKHHIGTPHVEEASVDSDESMEERPTWTEQLFATREEMFDPSSVLYPPTQQKNDLAHTTGLTRTQIDGQLSKTRQQIRKDFSVSHRATKGRGSVQQKTLTEWSSNWSDLGRSQQDTDDASGDTIYDGMFVPLLGLYTSQINWWFDTFLIGVGSQVSGRDVFEDPRYFWQSEGQLTSDNPSSSSSYAISSWDMCSNESRSLSIPDSISQGSTRRQGKRLCAGSRSSNASALNSNSTEVLFFCTFCDVVYTNRSAWSRHEREQHGRPALRVCEPSTLNAGGMPICSFCEQDLTASSCDHKVHECLATNNQAFQRKERIKGHLMRIHNLDVHEAKRASVGFKVDGDIDISGVDMTCYFCEETLKSWKGRAKHIGDHIRKGLRTKVEWNSLKAVYKQSGM